jgi:poly-gamma-glutamate synthesis protein (capsule biosynthesis protein)
LRSCNYSACHAAFEKYPQPRPWAVLFLVFFLAALGGCAAPAAKSASQPLVITHPEVEPTSIALIASPLPTAIAISPTPEPVKPRLWVSPALPAGFREALRLPAGWELASNQLNATLQLEVPSRGNLPLIQLPKTAPLSYWVYALVAPFPTVEDEISLDSIRRAWQGDLSDAPGNHPLLLSTETQAVFNRVWGPSSSDGVKALEAGEILDSAWEDQAGWAIIPFEEIEPRWKVLKVDGRSPLEQEFAEQEYPLAIPIWLTGQPAALEQARGAISLPTNRDPEKLTVLTMTGVTALSRHIGEVMEAKGVNYPARDIGAWLADSDLTHISNEVSFYKDCPKPGPERADMRFCSNPRYIELLETVGTDIVELTGNHNLDWGFQPYFDTLEMYRQRGWKTYGGGKNLEDARKPLLIEHNGNKLAFLGCSPAGPEAVWATADEPGSAPCDIGQLEKQVHDLKEQGYLPIVTFQAVETETYLPAPAQGAPGFRRVARAGAVIVSGSQSHVPQTMTFVNQNFVHYGLGNLFFDQMKPPEARQAFIDRHFFYKGKYLGVELLTTLLEESARPRPMTTLERNDLLQKIFSLSNWRGN